MNLGRPIHGKVIKEGHVFGTGDNAFVWLHGLNSGWQKEGIGKMMLNGEPIPLENSTIYCFQNPDQRDWSKNELIDIKNIILASGHTTKNIVGYSQGGMGACSALFKQSDFWDTVGIIAGKCGETQDYATVAKNGIKVKIWHHEEDPKMGNIIFKVASHLKDAGVDIEGYKYPGVSHALEDVFSVYNKEGYWDWTSKKLGIVKI